MENQKIATVAKKLGVTTQAVYKKLAKLGDQVANELIKENGATWLTPRGVEILEGAFETKHQNGVPGVDNLVAALQKGIEEKQAMILNQQEMIRQLLEKQAEERQRSDSIIMKLAHDLEDTRRSALAIETKVNALLPKPADPLPEAFMEPPKQVQIWNPPKTKNPAEGMGILQRFWIGFTHPERLRRQAEN